MTDLDPQITHCTTPGCNRKLTTLPQGEDGLFPRVCKKCGIVGFIQIQAMINGSAELCPDPECGGAMFVHRSDKDTSNSNFCVPRTRECEVCGKRVKTGEFILAV